MIITMMNEYAKVGRQIDQQQPLRRMLRKNRIHVRRKFQQAGTRRQEKAGKMRAHDILP